jgi:glycosyltransferase involved in cell wall biosynthesis
MPEVAKELGLKFGHAISWVDAMSQRLRYRDDLKLYLICPGNVNEVLYREIDNINYVIFPTNSSTVDYWGEVLAKIKPDVIHVYGTESLHNKLLFEKHNDYPIIISLQGILSEYQRHYYAGLEFWDMVSYTSIRDIIRPVGFFSGRRDFQKRSINEKRMLQRVKYVEGRSTWDKVSALNINPGLKYYYCPRMIRAPFFEYKWNAKNMKPHSIFVHQGNYPIKGIHFVFEALAKLKRNFSDVRLFISGNDFMKPQSRFDKLLPSGYTRYLKHLIKKLDIQDNIEYTGYLSANDLAKKISRVNVVVIPSAIENAPNSLAESTIVGVPTIASYVGGNMDMLTHNEEGYLYCFNEPNMLAHYIGKIFDDVVQADIFSNRCIEKYRQKHNPEVLENTLVSIYNDIVKIDK